MAVQVAAVQSQALQLSLVVQGLNEQMAALLSLLKIIVGEEEVGQPGVRFQAFADQHEGSLTHLVVTHVDLLDIWVLPQSL